MKRVCIYSIKVRILLLISVVMYSVGMWGAVYDFTPTDGGLVVNLKPGDQILLSTWVDKNGNGVEEEGEEFFVCHYPGYTTGSYFGYTDWDGGKGNFLKLILQTTGATEPASTSIWTIDDPVPFLYSGKSYPVDGIAYTMWSTTPGGDSYTLRTSDGNSFRFQGDLTKDANNANICNAVFVVPTNRSTVTSFDPNKTLTTLEGRTQDAQGRLNGEKGYGFLGLPYREVYWLDIPRGNAPVSYTNASVVGFNKTLSTIQYSNKEASARPGQALYAFGNKDKHHATPRTIFRLYVLNDPLTSTCADSYYFAYDEQDYKQYNKDFSKTATYTTKKKTYTIDRLVCMERIGDTKSYQTDFMYVPVPDSTYYYVGYANLYRHGDLGANGASSQFKKICELPIQYLTGFTAPVGACGRMVVEDTTSTADNLNVVFRPAGVFLRTNSGRNIRMRPNADGTVWTSEEMWHITAAYSELEIKATLYSGPEYSDADPGVDIPGWSEMVAGTSVPVSGGGSIIGQDGWARVYTNNPAKNGAIEFVPANPDRHIHYNNNGFVGSQIPDQYPQHGSNSVTIEKDRLVGGFAFEGWTTNQDGSGTLYSPGTVLELPEGELTLYAKATYTGTIHVALSFMHSDGKRYFLTHPGAAAPRFSRARRIDEWTDAWQGMENAENNDPRYINTFKLRNDSNVEEAGEFVLDPRRELRYGAKDSLLFYEYFAPDEEEYLGLYYTDPNTVLANTTWAGLFTSTRGWPDYSVADVQNTKLKSTHYIHRVEGKLKRDERSNSSVPFVKYNAEANQFDGTASEAEATTFQISRVRVADEHYVVIPDTTEEWINEITFGYHTGERTEQQVWSKLIGKQLMAVTKVGNDTVYFHPNRDKILTTAGELRLSPDYRLTESFTYIRDSRAEGLVISEDDKPHMTEMTDEFSRLITSGENSPKDVAYGGNYIDIVDTLRITLSTRGPVRIKDYYGRWKKGAEGLHIHADGSRHRDIIVRTKTYHYGPMETKLVLTPEFESYNFSPLSGASKQIKFTLSKVTSRKLLDIDGNRVREEVYSTEDVTPSLPLGPGYCRFTNADFIVDAEKTVSDHVTLVTRADNHSGINYDTLIVSLTVEIGGVDYPVSARVPLLQSALENKELVWSVVDNDGERYFIMAGSGGLIFRQFTQRNSSAGNPTLYKKNTNTNLIKGSLDAANSDDKYITPWEFEYAGADGQANQQLTLTTKYGINKNFVITGETTPEASDAAASVLTYEYEAVHVNDNANFEEGVRLKYGTDKWLKFEVEGGTPQLVLTTDKNKASIFSWGYLLLEYRLLNFGNYPDKEVVEFGYNRTVPATVQTRYKAEREYSMLLNNVLTYCGWQKEDGIGNLTNPNGEWLTSYSINLVSDSRFASGASGLTSTLNTGSLTSTITPTGDSPTEIRYPANTGPFVNIVDTLEVRLSLQDKAPAYRFKDKWSGFSSIEDAHLKIPLIRRTYHSAPYDSLLCLVDNDAYSYIFPSTIIADANDTHEFVLHTEHRTGTHVLNVENEPVSADFTAEDYTSRMNFTNPALAEIRLIDEFGNTPDWCEISGTTANSITVKCTKNGIRAPREAFVYIAYAMQDARNVWRYINFRLSVSQPSLFQYANNQILVHTKGASGDPLKNGMQQVHENRRILYYYNPSNAAQSTDQNVELPIRERGYYGWWRWYREGEGEIGDSDIPAETWRQPPTNTGKFNFPFRIIGDSVWKDAANHSLGKKLVTMGRYTVFHNPASVYEKADPPAKAPQVYAPTGKQIVIYVADLSNYYDNLPLSMKYVNQVDTAKLDTMHQIKEPTLSLREVFELHPWTEMADTLEHYKYPYNAPSKSEKYMEDHVVMAPLGNRLLLNTEQRYNYDNLKKRKHSESLLGYYMKDDNWETGGWSAQRKDSMIWCGGWDATCEWFTFNPKDSTYSPCPHPITEGDDFLVVPAKMNITPGQAADTVYYCLRARSKKTTGAGTTESPDSTEDGEYYFNICRYMVIYHSTDKYGPKLENGGKALITNDEIEQSYEVLERLNFDYNKPGNDYQVYPHPLPWADASYGYTYPETSALPHNRYHKESDFPNHGEYGLINRIPYSTYWHKMEQHGGAANGYMIYCDGMASPGQVAALSLETQLCEGQKMYFSGYVGNPSSQTGKSNPNFLFSVQGSLNGTQWEDITSYMTGDLQPSSKWYQIFFPIEQKKRYNYFRVRVYNMSSSFDGNDFTIDDMCIFATKPPLVAYQANTTCRTEAENDSITHVVLRVDYQGFDDKDTYNDNPVYYTIEQISEDKKDTTFVPLVDTYFNQATCTIPGLATIYGSIPMPSQDYEPTDEDSVFTNLSELIELFERTINTPEEVRQGYIYENLDGNIRPVMYVVHTAKMTSNNSYKVHMAGSHEELLISKCGMTSNLSIKNRMVLELNGHEQTEREVDELCANSTYDLSLRIKGALLMDNSAPIDINGSCMNDWLLYGDTAEASSETRYGYKYSDIVKVVKDILRCAPERTTNANQFARNLSQVKRNEMLRIQKDQKVVLKTTDEPYDVLARLVNRGFLTLYKSNITATTTIGDSIQYVIFPIVGTGSDAMLHMNVEVCPTPVFIKLKSTKGGGLPLVIGGFKRDKEEANLPAVVLVSEADANMDIAIPIDSIKTITPRVVLDTIVLLSTNDPNYLDGIHRLGLMPDRQWTGAEEGYYQNDDDTIHLHPSLVNNYQMRAGYNYTFGIELKNALGEETETDGCPIGTVPFVVSVVPNYLRWNPQSAENNKWNDPDNWIGINRQNVPIHQDAHFAPLATTNVIIPSLMPYPVLQDPASLTSRDSVKQTGFRYNTCDSIRFMSGAAMSQQQRLAYNEAVVDMALPQRKWALRSAPVNGMISGDLFMADADLAGSTSPWEAGPFDAHGRTYSTGNASYWLSVFSRSTEYKGNGDQVKDSTRTCTSAEWSKITNGMTLSLPPANGWAVFARTASNNEAAVRLPKKDDIYYYYTRSGDKVYELYEHNLNALRAEKAGGADKVGKLAFAPGAAATSESYEISNDVASTSFVFGNPTMGYIDIWGFIADNSALKNEIDYMKANGDYLTLTEDAISEPDTISSLERYLPPMQAIVLKLKDSESAATSLNVQLKTNRIVTEASQIVRTPSPAPRKCQISNVKCQISKGIMTVTAVNPVSPRCTSRLLIGQGYNKAVISGEDALLTTVNIDHYTNNTMPATPFNIYALEGEYGLSINLLNEVVNVPLSFFMSALPYDSVTYLWFTGVNNISVPLVLYDAFTGTERPIVDGICLEIETPENSHLSRYFIRRKGYKPGEDPSNPIATNLDEGYTPEADKAMKVIRHGHVFVLRDGHVYTVFGQKIR